MEEISYNKQLILNGVNKLAEAVLKTMGPNGKTMIIIDDFGRPYTTKDGVSVANAVSFKNPVEDAVATLVKEAAQETLKKVGDGTTTSICLTQAFINEGFKLLKKHELPYLIRELNNLEKQILEELIRSSKEITSERYYDVAMISTNGDDNISRLIEEAYLHSENVKVEESNKDFNDLIKVQGMSVNTPYFDVAFINNVAKQSIEYNEPMSVVIIDGHLNNFNNVKHVIASLSSVVIIADEFSKSVLSSLKEAYNSNSANIALVKSPSYATQRKLILEDIAKYTGAKVINPNKEISKINASNYIGKINSFISTKEKTIFFNENAEVDDIINKLKEAYNLEEDEITKNNLKQRLEYLQGNLSIIKVSGNTDAERTERRDRVDDAVLSVKAAIDSGVVKGGGVALSKSSDNLYNKGIRNSFYSCLYKPSKIIFNTDNLDNQISDDIIDPLKVTTTALSSAIAVTKTILSTEGAVISPRLWSQ